MLAWLSSLPPATLYVAMCLVSAAENFFPPLPSDLVVAFGGFLAARRGLSPVPTVLAVLAGSVSGAIAMYALGRRFGAEWLRRRLHLAGEDGAERIRSWYGRYGLAALFLSRFIPGVRALVPPLAGALHIPPLRACVAIAAASSIWYGLVMFIVFRLGTNWATVQTMLGRAGWTTGAVASALAAVIVIGWFIRRRARRAG
jgi:membrane protein DedA with SNARE-associated domain